MVNILLLKEALPAKRACCRLQLDRKLKKVIKKNRNVKENEEDEEEQEEMEEEEERVNRIQDYEIYN